MVAEFKKSFLNDVKKIIDQSLKNDIKQVILLVENAKTKKDIPNLKKLKGSKSGNFYRIKVDNYRTGTTIVENTVTFVVCMHRKDIYKFFP